MAGWLRSQIGSHGNHYKVAALLVAAGASVEPKWMADEQVRSDFGMLAAIRGEGLPQDVRTT